MIVRLASENDNFFVCRCCVYNLYNLSFKLWLLKGRIIRLAFKNKGFSRSSTYTLHIYICSWIIIFSEGDSLTLTALQPMENAKHKLWNTNQKNNELEKMVLYDFCDAFVWNQ